MKNYSSYLFILVLLLSNYSTYPMLILKQEKKHSPAYLCVKQRKLDKDPRIPQGQECDGFETIITVGKVVLENTGTIMKVAQSTATLMILNAASRWVTGKNFGEHTRNPVYDPELASRIREQKKFEEEYQQDMRMKHGFNPKDSAFTWDEKHQCFVDEYGDRHYIVNEPDMKPKTDVVYTGRSLPIVSPSKPADKAWLEDFAQKICPDGGYTIGDSIPTDEDLPHYIGEVAMPMPTPPNKPNNNKNSHHATHEMIEILVDNTAHHMGEDALEHVMEEWKEHDSEHSTLKNDIKESPVVKNTSHHKVPNYSSGKRLEYEAQKEKVATSNSVITSEPIKIESVKQETISKIEPVRIEGEKLPATGKFSSAPQESLKSETNSSRWAKDDYYDNSSSFSLSYEGNVSSSEGTFSSSSDVLRSYKDE